jgi:Lrp/AsnC family leucine-responsive transcriptional regulator
MNIQGKEKINLVRQISESLPQVIRCYHVTGEDEYIVHIIADSIEGLEDVLHQYSDYAKLITSIVINAPVEHRSIDLEQFPNLKDLET